MAPEPNTKQAIEQQEETEIKIPNKNQAKPSVGTSS